MDRIFYSAKARLQKLIDLENDDDVNVPQTSKWCPITSHRSGYFQDLNLKALKEIAQENNIQLEIIPTKGTYILPKQLLFKSNVKLDDKIIDEVNGAFRFSKSELIEDNYLLAFKQITEIAVKAMSPGINDPGTAINAIDYLTELFSLRLYKNDVNIVYSDKNEPMLKINTIDFQEVLFQVMAALRTYCSHDIIIVQKLFYMLNYLKDKDHIKLEIYHKAISLEIENLHEDATNSLKNKADLAIVSQLYSNT